MKKITESMIKESIEQNMDEFRSKALNGKVSGEDVANLFGYGDLYNEGEESHSIKERCAEICNEAEEDEESSNDEDNTETEDTVEYKDIDDFLSQTETKVTVKKIGCEPSAIFGPNDTKNHNKYKITIANPKGNISFTFWDSIYNTENNKTPSVEDAMYTLAHDSEAYNGTLSYEDFKSEFGYDETEDSIAQKAYEGCRKQYERVNKLFTKEEINALYSIVHEM